MWEAGTHVDFDRGLAYCVGQVRTALGDSADNPRFVETLPRRGYRFIAPVQTEEAASERLEAASAVRRASRRCASPSPDPARAVQMTLADPDVFLTAKRRA